MSDVQEGEEAAYLNARSARYSSPTLSIFNPPPRCPCTCPTDNKLEIPTSSSVMSPVSLSLPLSPSGRAILAWIRNVLRMYRLSSSTLYSR